MLIRDIPHTGVFGAGPKQCILGHDCVFLFLCFFVFFLHENENYGQLSFWFPGQRALLWFTELSLVLLPQVSIVSRAEEVGIPPAGTARLEKQPPVQGTLGHSLVTMTGSILGQPEAQR